MKLLVTFLIVIIPVLSFGTGKYSGAIVKYDCSSCEGRNELIFYKDLTYRSSYTDDLMKFVVTTGTFTFISDTLILEPEWTSKESLKLTSQRYLFRNDSLKRIHGNKISESGSFSEDRILSDLLSEADSKINKQNVFKRGMSKLARVQRAIISTDTVYVGHAFKVTGAHGLTAGDISDYINSSLILEMEMEYYYKQMVMMFQIRSMTANFTERLPDYPDMIMPAAFHATTYEIGAGYNFFKLPSPVELGVFAFVGRTSYAHETVGWYRQTGDLTSYNLGMRIGYNFRYDRNDISKMLLPVELKIGYFHSGYYDAYQIKGTNLYAGLTVGFKFNNFKNRYSLPK